MFARVQCSTQQLQLNSVGLQLQVVALTVNGSPRPLPSLTMQPDRQLATATAAAPFLPGDMLALTLSFSGALSQVNIVAWHVHGCHTCMDVTLCDLRHCDA